MVANFPNFPILTLLAFLVVFMGGSLVFYALKTKGDVSASLTHGRTILRIDARDKRYSEDHDLKPSSDTFQPPASASREIADTTSLRRPQGG